MSGMNVDYDALRELYKYIFDTRNEMGYLMNDVSRVAFQEWNDEEYKEFSAIVNGVKGIFEDTYEHLGKILDTISKMAACVEGYKRVKF